MGSFPNFTSISARPELTLAQAAVALECSERSVARLIKAGQLQAIRRDGRRLVMRESLRDFLRGEQPEAVDAR